jgi:hypothetical protein
MRRAQGVWVWYLTTGAVLAVTRVALFVWVVHQRARHIYTETNILILQWLYPELLVGAFGGRIVALMRAEYYLTWGTILTFGSFVMATPILLVGWLRHRRTTPPPSR